MNRSLLSFGLGRVFDCTGSTILFLQYSLYKWTTWIRVYSTIYSQTAIYVSNEFKIDIFSVSAWSSGYNSNIARHIPHSHSSLSMINGGITQYRYTAHSLKHSSIYIYYIYTLSQIASNRIDVCWLCETWRNTRTRTSHKKYSRERERIYIISPHQGQRNPSRK